MRKILYILVAVAAAIWSPIRCCADSREPELITRGQAQLFVDDHLIAAQTDLRRTLHQPTKDDGGNIPVISLDSEYEGKAATLEANGSIVYDTRLKKWVMYTVAFCQLVPGPDRTRIYRFTSSDALHWTKGDDGKPDHCKMDLLDVASGTSATNADLFSCYYDADDAERPYKGWCWFSNWKDREGIYYVSSRDGRKWDRGPPVMRVGMWQFQQAGRTLVGPSDVTIFYHDAVAKRYLAIIKFASPTVVGPNNALRSRAYTFVDSLSVPIKPEAIDHVELVPPASEANGEHPHNEYYASTGWRYESLWLGGLKVWHGGGNYPYSVACSAFLKLVVSHDGLHWHKVPFNNDVGVPEVFIANGKEGANDGRNDGGYLTEFSQGPLRIGDELIYYYGASSWGKNHSTPPRVTGGGIFRARLRSDGFVSVDRGTITTLPLAFAGDKLRINSGGPVQVEVLDRSGRVRGSASVDGNSLWHSIKFKDQDLRQLIPDGIATLRFTVANGGKLYSFAID